MNISDCIFTEKDIKQLQDCRDSQKDLRLKIRFIAVLSVIYNADGIEAGIEQTAQVFGKHTETVRNWLSQYFTGGAEKLNTFNYKAKKSYLSRHQINQVIIFVTYENPATVKEIANYINDKFSISYSVEAVRKLLIKNGIKVIRPRAVPGNTPGPDEQKKRWKIIIR